MGNILFRANSDTRPVVHVHVDDRELVLIFRAGPDTVEVVLDYVGAKTLQQDLEAVL